MLDMTLEAQKPWVRAADIAIGIVTIIVGMWITLSPTLAEATLVFSMAIGLVFIGLARVFKSVSTDALTTQSRAMKIISGLVAILLSAVAIVFRDLAITFLVTMLTFAIMLVGLSRMVVGYSEKSISYWLRALYVAGGGLVFLFGFFAAVFSGLGFVTLRLVLGAVFLILGSVRIIGAAKGELV